MCSDGGRFCSVVFEQNELGSNCYGSHELWFECKTMFYIEMSVCNDEHLAFSYKDGQANIVRNCQKFGKLYIVHNVADG